MDHNPLAGNVVDLCPVGALTSRDFRFNKRVWYLKPIPTISRHSAMASPLWADVDENKVWRFRPRHLEGKRATYFLFDDERHAFARYNLDPTTRLSHPEMKGVPCALEGIAEALRTSGPVAVVGQGTFGCDAAQRLGELSSREELRFGSGDKRYPMQYPDLQGSGDGVINRRGFAERGYRFGHLEELLDLVKRGEVKAVVLLHDAELSSHRENELLRHIVEAAAFSLALEPIPSELSTLATARLPVATYLEESDFVVNHDGELRRYQRVLQPPKGVNPLSAWIKDLRGLPVAQPV
jgi:NADH dehydrogenase/NADH:ubiquinone oxidoreductase subunit G